MTHSTSLLSASTNFGSFGTITEPLGLLFTDLNAALQVHCVGYSSAHSWSTLFRSLRPVLKSNPTILSCRKVWCARERRVVPILRDLQTSRGVTLCPSRSFTTTDSYCCTVTIIGSLGTITGRSGVTLQPTLGSSVPWANLRSLHRVLKSNPDQRSCGYSSTWSAANCPSVLHAEE